MHTMLRFQSNEKDTFSATLKVSSQETEAALRQRRSQMDQAWDDIDQGWSDLQQGMTEIGITKPSDVSDGMVRLNVGGSHVNVRRSVLNRKQGSSSSSWTLANLFQARWDKRLPVDTDGRVVFDESPIAVKHLIHARLTTSSAAQGAGELTADENPYLPFVARALGLSEATGMMSTGGSNILGPHVSVASKAVLQGWFPGESLEVKYRATRDGWTPAAFHAKCDDSSKTVTLFQVGRGRSASVVGGFSSISWVSYYSNGYQRSPGAFIFMLKDGAASGKSTFHPVKWGLTQGYESYAVQPYVQGGPCFGGGADLTSVFNGSPGALSTSRHSYNIPIGSHFLNLNGQTVSEIEVFRVCPKAKAATPPNVALSTLEEPNAPVVVPMRSEDDVRNFGVLIAGSLMEERMALRDAEIELRRARAKASSAAKALEAVYGPDIAAGKEDPVVELSVRGTRMTTLRSTLQVCPDSALATRFDEARWPANEKEVDEHGRRMIDCGPSVFSKVLDVLRMRKREAWAGGESQQGGSNAVIVAVKAVDRAPFEEFVNMHFPGCESFVNDYVEFLGEPQATAV